MDINSWPEDWISQLTLASAILVSQLKGISEESELYKVGVGILKSNEMALQPVEETKPAATITAFNGGKGKL